MAASDITNQEHTSSITLLCIQKSYNINARFAFLSKTIDAFKDW